MVVVHEVVLVSVAEGSVVAQMFCLHRQLDLVFEK